VVENKDDLLAEWYPEMVKRHANLKRMGLATSATVGAEESPDDFIRDRAVAGAPRDCVRQIARWREQTGCEAMLLLLNKRAPFEHLRSAIKLFGDEVLPPSREAALN
jgi:alkanesulfonate monooxygenase SsuD/methylene tetrahydromethanopterin reductase-like flavin-dependent oxidoreductase (luciferase family)